MYTPPRLPALPEVANIGLRREERLDVPAQIHIGVTLTRQKLSAHVWGELLRCIIEPANLFPVLRRHWILPSFRPFYEAYF